MKVASQLLMMKMLKEGNKYYYLVMVENKAGYLSDGQNISVVADPPVLDGIGFRDGDFDVIENNESCN